MEKRSMKQKNYKAIITIIDPEQNRMSEKEYELNIKGGSLNDIEASVSVFRNALLPDVEHNILNNEQREYLKKSPQR
jgi:hypothetical protein